jgi:DNA polymerase elongation subunit (family B)
LHLSATGAMINGILVRSYLQNRHSIPKADPLEKLAGGISFAVPGIYRNIKKIDLKSAYPSQVLRFKLHDPIKDPDANFYNVVKYFTEQRFYYKKMGKQTGEKKWKELDAAAKIFINSAYGTCSTNGLAFNSPSVAAKITLETRNVIDLSLQWASGYGKDYWIDKFKQATGKLESEEADVSTFI